MVLILEIALTIAAWRKGWKGWALLPLLLTVVFGGLVGGAIGAEGGSLEDILPFTLILDGICIVSLILLTTRDRRSVYRARQ